MTDLQDIVTHRDLTQLYTISDLIGVGATASVFRAITQDDKNVAIKKTIKPSVLRQKRLSSELQIMKECDHDNIVRYYESYLLSEEVWLVMEFVNGMSLEQLVWEPSFRTVTEDIIALVTRETLKGIKYIHEKGFIHRDIKSGNILVSQEGDVKITDFGLSTSQDTYPKEAAVGTICYMAPEVATGDPNYNDSVDIWSLGITIYEMVKGIPPMIDIPEADALKMLEKKEKPQILRGHLFSDEIQNIQHRCLQVECMCRPTASELLCDPFLKYACSFDKLGKYVRGLMHTQPQRPPDGEKIERSNGTIIDDLKDIVTHRDPTKVYTISDLLGVGGTASVYHAKTQDEENVAIKKIELTMAHWGTRHKRVNSELQIMKTCDHKNIVRYYESYLQLPKEVWLVMELVDGMSLEQLIWEPSFRTMTEDIIALVTRETLKGIKYIHEKGFIHRDIKSGNILVSQEGNVKITDFGLSTSQDTYPKEAAVGTICYMAPEVATGDPNYNQSVDIWSLGITIYEMVKGIPPMIDIPEADALKMLEKKVKPQILRTPLFSEQIQNIQYRCLQVECMCRPTASELLCDPFLTFACSFDKLGEYVRRETHLH